MGVVAVANALRCNWERIESEYDYNLRTYVWKETATGKELKGCLGVSSKYDDDRNSNWERIERQRYLRYRDPYNFLQQQLGKN
ncbi:MAG: hypothetical protein N3E41_08555 [Thermofilaceae archaeon]|nr:hypothetical protein [Thermofilaceae archaeon]